jgi:hypothetical protein
MTCEEARIRMAEEIGRGTSSELDAHLACCPACASEAASARNVWLRLGDLPDPEPRPYVATRFYAALDAFQMAERERTRSWFLNWWPSRPALQMAVSAACLVIGLFAGTRLTAPTTTTAPVEVSELQKEMAGMRQLVTLSLLQQQSATDRLRGVNYSYRAEPNDTEVLSALLQTVDSDPNVDVRLAAIDALRQFKTTSARRGLIESLQKQESPMVQIAIIDALSELKERNAAPAMRALLTGPEVDINVRKRVESVLNEIQ